MPDRTMSSMSSMILAAAVMWGSSTVSVAQSTRPDAPAKSKRSADEPSKAQNENPAGRFLAGPAVAPEDVDGNEMMMGRQTDRQLTVRPIQWRRIVLALDLSDDQKQKVDAIYREFDVAARAFRDKHEEELREIRQAQRRARQAGEQISPELRQRAAEIQGSQPRIEPYQERIWAELTEPQQEKMREELEVVRERMRAAQEEGRQRRMERANQDMTDAPSDRRARGNDPERDRFADLDEMGRMRLRFLLSRQLRGDSPPPRAPRPGDVVRTPGRRPAAPNSDRRPDEGSDPAKPDEPK